MQKDIIPAVVALIVVACASAPRNPIVDNYPASINGRTTIDYYDVHGSTFAELRADMRRNGPKMNDTSFVGETRSPMRWTWKTQSNGTSSCGIKDVVVSMNAQILLPRWTPPADTEPGLVTEWNRFIAALETHESGHKDISAQAARELQEKLGSLTGLCSQIGTRANDIARGIMDKATERQRAYDAETRHGLTQGTSFGAGRAPMVAFAGPPARFLLDPAPRTGTVLATLPAPVEQLWAVLPAAYAAVGLGTNARDSAAHNLGDSLTAHGRIGALTLGEIVACGAPPLGGNADSVDVSLFVTSHVELSPPLGTTLRTTIQAFIRPRPGSVLGCRSLGVLERQITLEARRRLQ